MNKNDQILDDFFRSKLESLEETPSPMVWEQIQQRQAGGAKQHKIRNVLRLISTAAAVLLAFFLVWNLMKERPIEDPVILSELSQNNTVSPEKVQIDTIVLQKAPIVEVTATNAIPVVERSSGFVMPTSDNLLVSSINETHKNREEEILKYIDRKKSDALSSNYANMYALVVNAKPQSKYQELSDLEKEIVAINASYYEKSGKSKSPKEWSVGAYLSPTYSVNQGSNSVDYSRSTIASGSKTHMDVGAGMLVDYHLNKRWSVQSGLLAGNLSQTTSNQTKSVEIFMSPEVPAQSNQYSSSQPSFPNNLSPPNHSNRPILPTETRNVMSGPSRNHHTDRALMPVSNPMPVKYNAPAGVIQLTKATEDIEGYTSEVLSMQGVEQNFTYLEVPLYVRYQLVDKTFGLGISGGVSTNILVGNKVYTSDGTGKSNIGKTQDMRELSYSTGIGLGLSYKFIDNLSAQVQPVFKYYLNSLSSNSSVDFRPYSFGIQAGISYRFGK